MHDQNNITTLHNTLQDNPSQGLHKDSTIESNYRVKVGSIHEEDFQKYDSQYTHILIINMPNNLPSTYLLIPSKLQVNKKTTIPYKIISSNGRVPQLPKWAQLAPSAKHLFPPKGE